MKLDTVAIIAAAGLGLWFVARQVKAAKPSQAMGQDRQWAITDATAGYGNIPLSGGMLTGSLWAPLPGDIYNAAGMLSVLQ